MDGPKNPVGEARNRPTRTRIAEYGLPSLVTQQSRVLDVGCNIGLFGIGLAPSIDSYLGIDSSLANIVRAKAEAAAAQVSNCAYLCSSFADFATEDRFDLILCFAVHGYFGISMEAAAEKLASLLKPTGVLVLEGHPPGYLDEPAKFFNPLHRALTKKLFVLSQFKVTDRDLIRDVIHYGFELRIGSRCDTFRLPDGKVKKHYRHREKSDIFLWKRERDLYLKLKEVGYVYAPQMLSYDEADLSLILSYAGERLCRHNLPADWLDQLNAIRARCEEIKFQHNDLFVKNFTVLDGVIHQVDLDMAGFFDPPLDCPYNHFEALIEEIKALTCPVPP